MKYILLLLVVLVQSLAMAKVVVEKVNYKQGDTALEGYLAYDDALKGQRPGFVIVHDWMGISDFVKGKAEALAKEGYVAIAADIYGKGVRAKNAEEAGKLAGLYKGDRKLMRARAQAALEKLLSTNRVNPKKVIAMGYCFGGTVALELARSCADLAGTVTFHGGLSTPTPADAKCIAGRILALHGADDPFVNEKEVAEFQGEMRNGGVDWQMISYGGAVHAFTNPLAGTDNKQGAAYNAKADKRSWADFHTFLKEVL